MEEFDFDLNNEIGTSVSQLRSRNTVSNDHQEPNNTDTDFDYDKVMEHFNSEQSTTQFNYDTNRDSIINTMTGSLSTDKITESFGNTQRNIPVHANTLRPKKQQNMNRFVRDLETNLDNFSKVNLNEPLPVNFTKPMISKQATKNRVVETMVSDNKKTKPEPVKEETLADTVKNFFKKIDFRETIILMLLFMVLNNKIVIEFIYDKIPYMQKFDSPYPNLIIRTLIFGIIFLVIKKFNL